MHLINLNRINQHEIKISAILPCYNHSNFLRERISSVLSQTLPVSQIIFLDDASVDNSFELASSLLSEIDIETVFCVNTKNSGSPFAQWNRGLALAKYPLVWIAETDDTCKSTLLESLVNAMASSSDVVLAFAQSRFISVDGEDIGSLLMYTDRYWPSSFNSSFTMDGLCYNRLFMARACSIPNASAVLFSKNAFIEAGLSNTSMCFAGDWDTWIRIAKKGRVAFVSDELNSFRCHNSTSRSQGIIPQVVAENLACKIMVMLNHNNQYDFSINAFRVLKIFLSNPFSLLTLPIRQFKPHSIRDISLRYSMLSDVPPISPSGWTVLWTIYFLYKIYYIIEFSVVRAGEYISKANIVSRRLA
jgi:glycosyltransferase involved in cell wall biosynthesis